MAVACSRGWRASFLRAPQAPPTEEDPEKWLKIAWDGGGAAETSFAAPATFRGVGTSATADFKPAVGSLLQRTVGGTSEMISPIPHPVLEPSRPHHGKTELDLPQRAPSLH